MTAVVVIAMTASVHAQTPCEELATYPVRLAILGDRTGDHQEGIYEGIVAEVERMRPDIVMTVGDMIEGYTSDTAQMREQWDEYLEIVKPLGARLHFTPGNHDITSDAMEPAYRTRIGEPYHSFDYRSIHFVVLDVSRWESTPELPAAQLAWLSADLAANQNACYTLVFFHKPFWYRTIGDSRADSLHTLFRANGVDAVFTGHFHQYFSADFDGIKYTSLGSSGGETEESPDGLLYQFGWVTIDGEGIHVAPVKSEAVLPWTVQSLAQARAANSVQTSGITYARPLLMTDDLKVTGGTITALVRNPLSNADYSDTLRWDSPQGWSVAPAVAAFTVPGGGETTVEFDVSPPDSVTTMPSLSTRLPYAEGQTTRVSRTLEVARTTACAKADGGVTIDGQLTEPCWRKPQSVLLAADGTVSKQDSTAFYFAYDRENLYMAVYCREAMMDSLRAVMTERDAAVYTEEAVGLMVQPEGVAGADLFQVYVNPRGTVCDQRITRQTDGYWAGDSKWNGEYEVKTVRGDDHYIVELRFPLAQIGAAADSGERWRVNFRRKQFRLGSAAAFQAYWSYDPTWFGELVFE
jgi:predicted phosphodiesterase